MSLILKRIILVLLGLLGACMAWPCLMTVQYVQDLFSGYLSFTLVQGMLLGMVFGAVFGSMEGIVVSSKSKALSGLGFGLLAGIASGALGVVAGQSLLFRVADALQAQERELSGVILLATKAAGWTVIGICVSMIEGFRARSLRKTLAGLCGGVAGGIIGGLTLQGSLTYAPNSEYALLAGLALFGLSISLSYAFFENRFSFGAIKLLNGPLKNKEYTLCKARMSIGSKDTCDIVLKGYRDVSPLHGWISLKKGRVLIQGADPQIPIRVNDDAKEEVSLRREDVFALGSAKFMYGVFS